MNLKLSKEAEIVRKKFIKLGLIFLLMTGIELSFVILFLIFESSFSNMQNAYIISFLLLGLIPILISVKKLNSLNNKFIDSIKK